MVTAAVAETILVKPKVIGANISWKSHGSSNRLEATVLVIDTNEVCYLKGYVGRTNRSLVLLYNITPIRKWTVHSQHRNPDTGEIVREPHKHTWDDEYEDRIVYIPDDIRVGDINNEFIDFLAECNITMRGQYVSLRPLGEPHEQIEFGI
jgi:hypothetical protein